MTEHRIIQEMKKRQQEIMNRKKQQKMTNFGGIIHDPMVDNDATYNILDGVD